MTSTSKIVELSANEIVHVTGGIGLLLPAVQKVREAPGYTAARVSAAATYRIES